MRTILTAILEYLAITMFWVLLIFGVVYGLDKEVQANQVMIEQWLEDYPDLDEIHGCGTDTECGCIDDCAGGCDDAVDCETV